jgi:PAS domain S-box-containing protein
MTSGTTRRWRGYTVAVVGTAVATLIGWPLQTSVSVVPLYLTFFPAVFIAALVGGTGPGVLATLLSALTANLLFLEHGPNFKVATIAYALRLGLFLATSFAISVLGGRFRTNSGLLRQNEERFRTMANAIPQQAWIARADGYVFWFNRRCFDYTGATQEQLEGWGWESVVDPQLLPKVLEHWRRSIRTGEPYEMQSRLRGADGRFRPFLTRAMPLKDRDGKVALWFGTHTDITELHEAKEALRQSEERLRLANKATSDVVWDWDVVNDCQRWNEAGAVVFGWTEIVEHSVSAAWWLERVHPDDLPRVEEGFFAVFKNPETDFWHDEYRFRKADGSYAEVVDRGYALRDKEGKAIRMIGAMLDITQRKRAEAALRESEEKFRSYFDRPLVGISITSPSKGQIRVNGKYCEILGYSADELMALSWDKITHPDDLGRDLEQFNRLVAGEIDSYTMEKRFVHKNGGAIPTILSVGCVRHPDRTVNFIVATVQDITERKRDEEALAAAKQQLQEHAGNLERLVHERTAKLHEAMAELEHMSYSMVHDMRAPLRAMQSFAQLMQEECAGNLPPPALDYLRRIRAASNRLDRLVTDALSYNEVVRQDLPMTPVDLGKLLRGMVKTYPNLHPPAADITIELPGLLVLGNESLLTQCFGNLLDNAVKFVAPGVHPRVRVWAEPSTLNHRSSTLIHIQDNGIGIPKDGQERIFRMFHRMHRESEYPGTGIGLAIVRKAVERMSGRISLDSGPGKGSRFCVELLTPDEAENMHRLQAAPNSLPE